eukprot:TRINITY_DN7396_c0_g2_i5.p1 TRINITY_DN7396_c0_g2~~TRINITY_DN7396_c0_g2_i5.p1  ORF type:complete len:364 (-),score=68.08 TRINITY_DN7396_c0_g2_i5:15-1106(-)
MLALFCYQKRKSRDHHPGTSASWGERKELKEHSQSQGDLSMNGVSSGQTLGSVFASKRFKMFAWRSDSDSQITGTDKEAMGSGSSFLKAIDAEEVNALNKYQELAKVSFDLLKPIGSGAFGRVFRVEVHSEVVAVKVPINFAEIGSKEHNQILSEARFLSKLRHENITTLLGYGMHMSGSVIFVMEFAESSLAQVLRHGPLEYNHLTRHAHSIIRGLEYLHKHSPAITHRDLKPENVLFVNGVAKLADFGLATAREVASKTTGFAGTPYWSPPESFAGKFTGPAGDVYTYGLLIWAMLTGKTPYEGARLEGILIIKTKNQTPNLPPGCPSQLARVMKLCWRTNPKQRPKSEEINAILVDVRNL